MNNLGAVDRAATSGGPFADADGMLRLVGANVAGVILMVLAAVRSLGEDTTSSVVVWTNVAVIGLVIALAAQGWSVLDARRAVRSRSEEIARRSAAVVAALEHTHFESPGAASVAGATGLVTTEGDAIRWYHRSDCPVQRGHQSVPWSPSGGLERTPCPVCQP